MIHFIFIASEHDADPGHHVTNDLMPSRCIMLGCVDPHMVFFPTITMFLKKFNNNICRFLTLLVDYSSRLLLAIIFFTNHKITKRPIFLDC